MPLDSASWTTELVTPESQPRAPVPTFEPRTTRLDYRPVAWSLRYCPDDWRMVEISQLLVHMPSQHVFYTKGKSFHLYWSASRCSCEGARNRASFADWVRARLALKTWRKHGQIIATLPADLWACGVITANSNPIRGGPTTTSNEIVAINRHFAGHFLPA